MGPTDRTASAIAISWTTRPTPLRPAAILCQGAAMPMLARALADGLARGAGLEIHASDGFLLAFGDEADLPWVDGATWLGRDGPLLLPTTLEPSLDGGLVRRAVARRIGAATGWVVLLPDRLLTGPRSVGTADVGRLRAIAASESG